jgi:TENA/THI-4/PQQC family protein
MHLHPDVSVSARDGFIDVRFAHWELQLPADAVDSDPEVQSLLARRSAESLNGSTFASAIRQLFEAQGCLLKGGSSRISLRELFRLIQPIRSRLYAIYYGHPLWALLASGQATKGQFAAWVIHNYHVSRSAGVIAARRASRADDPAARQAYRKDALEEFWHCDAFYFVRHRKLLLEPEACKAYVPLPGSRAFEDLALRAAETDGLAHLLIAYFQESSIVFRRESEGFYDRVEERFGLPGFFDGWRRHLALDIDQDHAGGLAALFDSAREVPREEANRAILCLQMAHHFLVSALDQALSCEGDEAAAIADRQPGRLRQAGSVFLPVPLVQIANETRVGVLGALCEASFEALGRADSHDEIMAAGGLAAALAKAGIEAVAPERNPWMVAARNFLIERSGDACVTLQLAREAITFLAEEAPPTDPILAGIDAEISRGIARLEAEDRTIERLQLREFLSLAVRTTPLLPLIFDADGIGENQNVRCS